MLSKLANTRQQLDYDIREGGVLQIVETNEASQKLSAFQTASFDLLLTKSSQQLCVELRVQVVLYIHQRPIVHLIIVRETEHFSKVGS